MSSDLLCGHNRQLSDASLCIVSTLTWQQRLTGTCKKKKKQVFNISVRAEGSDAPIVGHTYGSMGKMFLKNQEKMFGFRGKLWEICEHQRGLMLPACRSILSLHPCHLFLFSKPIHGKFTEMPPSALICI